MHSLLNNVFTIPVTVLNYSTTSSNKQSSSLDNWQPFKKTSILEMVTLWFGSETDLNSFALKDDFMTTINYLHDALVCLGRTHNDVMTRMQSLHYSAASSIEFGKGLRLGVITQRDIEAALRAIIVSLDTELTILENTAARYKDSTHTAVELLSDYDKNTIKKLGTSLRVVSFIDRSTWQDLQIDYRKITHIDTTDTATTRSITI